MRLDGLVTLAVFEIFSDQVASTLASNLYRSLRIHSHFMQQMVKLCGFKLGRVDKLGCGSKNLWTCGISGLVCRFLITSVVWIWSKRTVILWIVASSKIECIGHRCVPWRLLCRLLRIHSLTHLVVCCIRHYFPSVVWVAALIYALYCRKDLNYRLGSTALFLLLNAEVIDNILVFLDYDCLLLVVSFRTDLIPVNHGLDFSVLVFSSLFLKCLVSFPFNLEPLLIRARRTQRYQAVVTKLVAFSLS